MKKISKKHLAVFVPPFLDLILEGKKTVEGRFSKVRCAPFGAVEVGDTVLMKDSGGLVRGSFIVSKIDTYKDLNISKLSAIRDKFDKPLSAYVDDNYWDRRSESKYATLLHVSKVERFKTPYHFPKRDRRGWMVLGNIEGKIEEQLHLFKKEIKIKKYDALKSDCLHGLHAITKSNLYNGKGELVCKWCKADVINWSLLHERNPQKIDTAISELRKEFFRNEWFEIKVDKKMRSYVSKKQEGLENSVYRRLKASVASKNPYRDGYQTPFSGNIIFCAQHAIAACCRKCIEKWHGIPRDTELSNIDIQYLTKLIIAYIETVLQNNPLDDSAPLFK